jgi:nitrogen fixation protein NifU and related proteins
MRRYSPAVVDHFTNPRHLGRLDRPDVSAEVANPCCGDRLRLEARLHEGRVAACAFLAHGCAATIAIGSLLTEAIAGQTVEQLAGHDEGWIANLAGGLPPSQRHCAVLGRDLLQALVRHAKKGVLT